MFHATLKAAAFIELVLTLRHVERPVVKDSVSKDMTERETL